MTIDEKRLPVVLANIRRIKSKAWGKRNRNWCIVADIFGLGMTSSLELCKENGVDPWAFDAHATASPPSTDRPSESGSRGT